MIRHPRIHNAAHRVAVSSPAFDTREYALAVLLCDTYPLKRRTIDATLRYPQWDDLDSGQRTAYLRNARYILQHLDGFLDGSKAFADILQLKDIPTRGVRRKW